MNITEHPALPPEMAFVLARSEAEALDAYLRRGSPMTDSQRFGIIRRLDSSMLELIRRAERDAARDARARTQPKRLDPIAARTVRAALPKKGQP